MHREGHNGMAMLVYASVGFVVLALGFETLAVAGGVLVVGGAMLPDVDQRVPGVTHRGPTHTVWFALAVGLIVGVVGAAFGAEHGIVATIVTGLFGVFLGTLTVGAHILADILTPTGVRPFAPMCDRKYTLAIAKAANPLANYALLALGILAVAGAGIAGLAVSG